ncbi:MAG: alpha/beta hydrolase [Zetaproteobacteria bacterium CG12_big_fil_rev_8_21_14_0_65_54_13]|nr:MAG: alpha/beta hydrolase [Zetaproteobacteria bacterium CG23_combo_of_CG06-09_8_20_14_all_54_7]PIW50610.1 MAG: alpha/beta hydrolase [Zetaproteobacteria bacterium CG12_big_fil_rev_8_21_14_0_65_54_13]PIX54448.1 MAG: alpha/beta hydrolase [Zetaproteobacteria bacterium CG_4_10_14_3_um_filter_54_28]PJA28848.1 MAG: alpha/beta hydrolase [Zetaproteobacteria bacterium CG_4_9_14_3_um_filter_54_145]
MTLRHHEKLFLSGPAGRLQALYQAGEPGRPAVVICHPHPQYGGTMNNKVVYWMGRAFEDMGCTVLRFNFRGVEQSEGEWDDGVGEADDAAAALEWLHARAADSALWQAGFSFGCLAGLKAAHKDKRVERMFAVAPAVNLWSFDFLNDERRPVTVVSGTADEIVPFDAVRAWCDGHAAVRLHAISGAGHFFPAHMDQMMAALVSED